MPCSVSFHTTQQYHLSVAVTMTAYKSEAESYASIGIATIHLTVLNRVKLKGTRCVSMRFEDLNVIIPIIKIT
jgi:hypothetical protein